MLIQLQSVSKMKSFSENLEREMQNNLEKIVMLELDSINYAETALNIVIQSFGQLREAVKNHAFENKQQEIEFFKYIKPAFSSKLIYFNEIFRIETEKPEGSPKTVDKFYNNEEKRLNEFYKANFEFYKYYRSRNTSRDKKYFTRRKCDIKMGIDSYFFQSDFDFNTTHDFLVAQILANKLLQQYLNKKREGLLEIRMKNKEPLTSHKNPVMQWTGSKVALVELLYALHASGVLNNGKASLNKIAQSAEAIFNIQLNQPNRVFLEIKNRKSMEQTAFLNHLKDNLVRRIQESDK